MYVSLKEFEMSEYDLYKRHGGPYDRGSADAYYRRPFNPHYFTADTYNSERVDMDKMTQEEFNAYQKGFDDMIKDGNFKDWG
jgi:hypothetical protein